MGERYKDEERDKKEFFRGGPLGVEDMVVLGGKVSKFETENYELGYQKGQGKNTMVPFIYLNMCYYFS